MSRQEERDRAAILDRERRALQVLANCIGDVVGVRSEAYRNLVRASTGDNPLDMRLAQLSFEALEADARAEIWRRVRTAAARDLQPMDPTKPEPGQAGAPGVPWAKPTE